MIRSGLDSNGDAVLRLRKPYRLFWGWWLVLLLLLVVSRTFAESDATRFRVQWGSVSEQSVWVGEQLLIPMTLLMKDRQRGTPKFRMPDVPGGVIIQIPGAPLFDTEEIDGLSFASWTYEFAFYAQQAGVHTLPAMEVQVQLPHGNGVYEPFTAWTQPITLRSDFPEGAENAPNLVTTTKLDSQEQWVPEKTDIMVGDAITRSITLSAVNVLGMGFPLLQFDAPEGVSKYPKTPVVNEQAYRGEVTGQRIESLVYVFEREGATVIPGLTVSWFDPGTEKLKEIIFPKRTFVVSANPSFESTVSGVIHKDTAQQVDPIWPLILVCLVPFGLWLLKRIEFPPQRVKTLPPLNPVG